MDMERMKQEEMCWAQYENEKAEAQKRVEAEIEEAWKQHDLAEAEVSESAYFDETGESEDSDNIEDSAAAEVSNAKAAVLRRRKASFKSDRKLKNKAKIAQQSMRKRGEKDDNNREWSSKWGKVCVNRASQTAKATRLMKAAKKRELLSEEGCAILEMVQNY